MNSDVERKNRLQELFPEAFVQGALDLEKLGALVGAKQPEGVALALSGETLHSLRNCAAVIQSSARLLQRRGQTELIGEIVDSMVNAAEKMRQLLHT